MKKLFAPLSILLFPLTVFCQNIDMPQHEVSKLLCRKWTISIGEKDNEVTHDYPRLKDYYVQYFPDGTLILNRNGKKFTGVWCYDNEKKHVEFKTFDGWLVITHLTDKYFYVVMKKDREKLKKGERPNDYGCYVPIN